MDIVCEKCDYRFERMPGADAAGPPEKAVCPRCGAEVDVEAQITAMASRTTEGGGGARPDGPGPDIKQRTLGDYEILEEVSRGAMGVIYKARHKTLRRVVAVKVMIAGEHASSEQIARFEKEARAAAKLRHPNIVPIYDIGVEDGNRFFTMDFIEGRALDALVANGELTVRRSLEIAAAIADALAYAHAEGVIHRDIKPSNIMVDQSGHPQIMDFGLAKQLDSDTKFTRTGTTIGTPSYMAPEQARGENQQIDQRSDIYALGAVMYEMLTGRPPFTGETMMNIVMKVIHDDPAPLRRINPKMHRDIETIVLKAMEKEPRRRYQSMSELAGDIRRYMAGEMIAARPAGPFRRVAKGLRKYRAAIVVGLVIAVLGAGISGAIILTLLGQRAEETRKADEAERARLASMADQEPEWVVFIKENFSRPQLAPPWRPSGSEWRIENGRLTVDAPGNSHILLNQQLEGNLVVEFTAWARSANSRINCFLGSSRRGAYTIRFGDWQGHTLSLYRLGSLLAEVDCPPIKPNEPYRFRIERRNTALICQVSGGGDTRELRYDDPELLRGLGRAWFGFYTWACSVGFDDLQISRQQFAGQRLNELQAIDFFILSKGLLERALAEYKAIIEKHRGQLIAVLAGHNCGLIQEALGRGPERELRDALRYYRYVERNSDALTEKHKAVRAKNKERIFFVLVRMGLYEQAAAQLAALCDGGERIDAGSAWKFPALLSRCAGDLAYEPALRIMEKARFGGPDPMLRDQWQLSGPRARGSFAKALTDVCLGFAGQGKYEEMKRAFATVPDPRAAVAFEAAVARAVAADNPPAALDLLLFANEHRMRTPRLEELALTLAQRFIASKQFRRITNAHTAYPARSLSGVFDKAVSGLVGEGDITGAIGLFKEACERFPEDRAVLSGSADLLMSALLRDGQFADVRRVHAMLGGARLTGRLIQAAQAQLDANDLEGAYATLEYVRVNIPERARELDTLAVDLATKLIVADELETVLDLFEKYPSKRMAEPFAVVIATASKADNRVWVQRLMMQAIANFAAEPRVVAATQSAARTLIAAGAPELVLETYEAAARVKADDRGAAAGIRLDAAALLLAGKAYDQAAAAYAAAAKTPPKDPNVAARAMARAAVILQYLDETESAQEIWSEVPGTYPKAAVEVHVARLMTGAVTPSDFNKWLATNPQGLEPGEGDFYLALHAAASGNHNAAHGLYKKAAAGGKNSWFRGIAEAALEKALRPRPVLIPRDEPKS